MKRIGLWLAAAMLSVACTGGRPTVAGTYAGTLPAADCPGIEVELTLLPSGEYAWTSEYLERDFRLTETGRYRVENGTVTVTPKGSDEAPTRFRIEKEALRMLDTEGRVIEGGLSENYVLKKTK